MLEAPRISGSRPTQDKRNGESSLTNLRVIDYNAVQRKESPQLAVIDERKAAAAEGVRQTVKKRKQHVHIASDFNERDHIRMPSNRHRRLETSLIQDFLGKHIDHHILLRLARKFVRSTSEYRSRKYLAGIICDNYDSVQHILRSRALPKRGLRQFCIVHKIAIKPKDSRTTIIQKIVHHVRIKRRASMD